MKNIQSTDHQGEFSFIFLDIDLADAITPDVMVPILADPKVNVVAFFFYTLLQSCYLLISLYFVHFRSKND